MANTLMFEVGIKSAQEQLEKIKQEFTKANGELSKLLNIKVSIDGLDAVTRALSQIGDTSALRSLRNEIADLNREFSILSKGAGGSGNIAGRGLLADIEKTTQSIERYTNKIRELTEQRSRLVGGTRNSNYQSLTDDIMKWTSSLEGAQKKLAELNEQKNKPVASEPLKKSTQDAQAFETALGRIETAIGGLKSGMNVNLTGDFARWATEIQNVTAAVKELVEQFKQLQQGRAALAKEENKVVAAEEKLSQLRGTGTTAQTSLFDVQKFQSLQEVIDKIIGELNRLQGAFAGIGKIEGLTSLTTDINALMHNVTNLKDVLSNLSAAVKLDSSSEIIQKLTADFDKVRKEADAAQQTIRTLTEQLNNLAAAQNKVSESASKTGKTETQVTDSQKALFNRYQKLMADLMNIKREIVNIQQSKGGGGAFGRELGDYFSNLNRIRNEIREITSAPSLADAIAKGMSSEKLAKLASSLSALRTSYKESINEAKAFNKSVDKGSSQSETRIKKLGIAFNELKNYIKANGGSDEMHRLQAEIQGAIQKMRQLMNVGDYTGAVRVFDNMSGAIRQAANATKAYDRAKNQATSSTIQLTDAEQKLAHAIKGSTDQMRGQVNILSDLKSMAMQYLGVWGAQQFVHNIIQIGGQLEQQRLSIGAILGDMAAGQHLFDQIKELALTSPFGVMELDKDTKQLSAYGFKQSELFDMTKRLADISAGAGTEVSRLALALGHVRSEGALTGYTLRQFAMNNIPMLQKLSERLTKIEGQIVSTSEIRKRVSKKEIGYEDVIAVIKDLTNEGGMFFNMQETMAEAVNAKFKNLKDSMDIMYGEMAEGGIGSALKKVAESLMFLTRNWEETARVVGYGTAAFIAYRVAVASANTQLMTYGSTVGITSRTLNAKAIALGVNTAAVRRLTASEVDEMVTMKLLTREQLLNAVATKKLTVDQAELAAATFGVTRAELTSIATKGKLGLATTGLGLRLRSLVLSIRGVGVALKSMLLNPVGLTLMAITGAFEVFMRWKQRNEEIAQSIDQLGKKGSEGYKNLAATMEKYSGKDGKMSESEYSTAIDDIIDQLKNYAPNIHNIQEEAQSIDSLSERYKYLRDELESTKKAYADLERTKSFASHANEATGNMLNDTFTENVEEYISNVQKVDEAEQELMQHRVALEKTLDELEKKTEFKRRTDENGNVMSLVEQLKYIRSTDWNKVFSPMLYSNSQGASAALNAYSYAFTQMEERMRNEVMPDLQNFASRLNNQYAGIFGKDWKENADHIKTAWMAVVSEIDKVPGMTDNVKRELLEKIFNETWHMNIDFSTGEVTESLTGWRKEMQDWLDANGLNFRIGFNDSREDIYKKAKAAQETAQTAMNNAGQVLVGIGFKLNNLPSTLPSPLATPWNQKNLEDYNEQKNINELWEKFQKHFGANWQTKQDKSNNKKSKSEDKDARRLREIIKLYKDAYEWYTKYEKQVGEGSALKKVQEQFKPLFDQFKDQFKQELSLDSIPLYKENLESLLDEAEKLYKNPKHKNSYMVEVIKQIRDAINNVDFEELGRKQEDFLSKTQLQLDNLTRSWETFNAVREATGNVRLAVELSGADYVNGETRNLADSIKKKIQRDFAQAGSVGIPFDINLSDREIKESIEKVMPAAAEDQLKGLIEEYKKWRDLQRDVLKRDINTFAKLVGSAKDYNSQIKKINDNLKQQIEANNRLVDIGVLSAEEAMRANSMATVQAEDEKWKLSFTYSQLMNNSLALTRSEVENGITKAVDMLNQKMKAGLITAQEFAEEMAKIQNVRSEWTNSPISGAKNSFTAGLFGGFEGRRSYLQAQMKQTAEAMARELQKLSGGSGTFDAVAYDRLSKKYEGDSGKLNRLDSFKSLTDKFQALSKTLEPVIDLFNKLGMSEVGQVLGIGQNALQSAASTGMAAMTVFGQAAGPWGMAAGAAISVVGGLFSMMDSALQEEIDASKARQQEMENLTKNLEKALERTLGGVYRTENSAEDRRKLQEYRERYMTQELVLSSLSKHFDGQELSKEAKAFYAEVDKAFSKAQQTNSYYDTQRAFLYAQRYELQKQLSAEKGKKNSDDSAIADYKQQLAELEDQIKYFALDMAKALYDIDIQSWASDLTDAIVDAWENGEDAAEAYANKVKDLMKDLTKNILTKKVMEKAFENAGIDKLIADMMDVTSGKLDYTMVPELAKALAQAGQDSTDIITRVLDELERMGYIEKGEGSGSGSVTSGIKSITENTADLLASYLNATRASTANIENLSAQYFPLYYTALTSSNQSLRGIENNTAAIMRSNEVVADKITSLDDNINGLRNNTWRVPVS